MPKMGQDEPGGKNRSFFSPAQAHVGESAQLALAAMIMLSPNAKGPSCGMGPQVLPGKMSRGGWSPRMVSPSASTGKSQRGAPLQVTLTDTGVQGAESPDMGLRHALEQRRLEPLSPYNCEVWASELARLGLLPRYPSLIQGLASGFDLGILRIDNTYTPRNHHSIKHLHTVYNEIVEREFAAGRYIGPFTRQQLEANLGPFQTSPLSLVPKTSKPGKYRAVHDFSHLHNPLPNTASINSHIDSAEFPCTWGTFTTVALLIARLPPGSQASVCDVTEAYRTIPVTPSQWPGLVICLQADDQFAVNVCNNFGLTSAGGVYGMVADAGADMF